MWNDIMDKGLMYVHQLFRDKELKTEEEVNREFGVTWLRYKGLVKAIPGHWKEFFLSKNKLEYLPLPPHNYDKLFTSLKDKITKTIYKHVTEDLDNIRDKYNKWKKRVRRRLL